MKQYCEVLHTESTKCNSAAYIHVLVRAVGSLPDSGRIPGVCAPRMGSLRRFTCDDLLRFNNINLDVLTETYNMQFYLQYLATWPEYFMVEEAPHGQQLTSYIMGKAEGKGELWHGHVTAVTVAPEYRRLGRAKTLMDLLEEVSERDYNAYFVDLFVRVSNSLAINMYNKFGYSVFRRVIGYYSGDDEDAFDMRKALPRDRDKKSVIPMTRPVYPSELEW